MTRIIQLENKENTIINASEVIVFRTERTEKNGYYYLFLFYYLKNYPSYNGVYEIKYYHKVNCENDQKKFHFTSNDKTIN